MRICIITMHGVWNYGSVLQSLASQKFFSDLGLSVEFINYKRDDYKSIPGFLKSLRKRNTLLSYIVKAIIIYPTLLRWRTVFGGFCRRYIKVSSRLYLCKDDFKDSPIEADIYCTGSDQVWNSKHNDGISPMFFLDFAPKGKKRISFSASFGKDELEEWEKSQTADFLRQYDFITVREKSGVDICHNLGLQNVRQILDPTLLQPKEFWKGLMGRRKIEGKYLLVYQLHKETGMDEYLKEVARRLRLTVVRVCYRYDEITKYGKSLLIPSVEDLLSAIYYSSLVVTDSFHITAFSTNFNKDFISIIPEQQFGGRISSLLELTGLKARAIHRFDDFSPLENRIEWDSVNKIYCSRREDTIKLFKEILSN